MQAPHALIPSVCEVTLIVYDCTYGGLKPGLSKRIETMAPELARCGCNAVKFPPFLNTKNPFSLGYDPRTDLDVGQWEPLHVTGTADDLKSAIDKVHKYGMLVIQDWVNRQYGGPAPLYERGADGKLDHNLFPKPAQCFSPPKPRDTPFAGNDGPDDGIIVSYQHSNGYMINGKIQAGKWQQQVLGIDGFRLDEAKGLSTSVTSALAKARPGLNFAEVYDGDPATLSRFVEETGMAVLDFTRHFAYRGVSQGSPLSSLVGNGFCFHNPDHAYIYVESNDTDGPDGIVNNKLWFYLDAMTMPCKGALIFAKDYEVYGLAPEIRNIMWIASTFAIGKLNWEYVDDTLLCWSRDGDGGSTWSGGLFCGYSTDPINYRTEWVHTPFGPHRQLHDYTGHGPDVWTNQDGWARFTFGPNRFQSAQNYVAYAPAGVNHEISIDPKGRRGSGRFKDFSTITVRLDH
jgi:alpha-amylase